MIEDPKTRRQLAQQGRLWALSVLCALAGALTISRTGSIAKGVLAFGIGVAVLGGLLWVYERRHGSGRSGH